MKSILRSNMFSLVLLASIAVGGAAGLLFGTKAEIVKPFGDLFLNLLFMLLVPLIFFSISSAIADMGGMRRLGRILGSVVIVFIVTALVAAVLGLAVSLLLNPTQGVDYASLLSAIQNGGGDAGKVKHMSALAHVVDTFTVSDFSSLLSKKAILPLIVMAVLTGSATAMLGDAARPVAVFLRAASQVVMKMVQMVMYIAPVGLGSYFANVIGELGPQIVVGYLRTFLVYIVLAVMYYFVFYSLYAYIAAGKKGFHAFWRNALTPSVTAVATCSSAACIPINMAAAESIGVPRDMAETVIPLGANTHKDGSVFGGVLKIIFLFGLFSIPIADFATVAGIIGVAFLVGAVMGAIPGGGTIGEMLIISVYGFPPEALPLILVISTIIDAPATLLNSVGNLACSMLIARLVEGRGWLERVCK